MVAKIVVGLAFASISATICCLSFRSSNTASITTSQRSKPTKPVPPESCDICACSCALVKILRCLCLSNSL
ncbi:Uncharacterised protein [Vibrio cholerae]|nr:Uncharacterised protein [Vibrio cholerae]